MAKAVITAYLDDKQLADVKKCIKQSQLKNESELTKIRKAILDLNKRLNDILSEIQSHSESAE